MLVSSFPSSIANWHAQCAVFVPPATIAQAPCVQVFATCARLGP
jgi:hypothetical protein